MGFERFCAKCGRQTEALISGVCSECFLKKGALFEVKGFDVERCVKCGKARVKGKWREFSNSLLAGEVVSKVKVLADVEQPKVFVEIEELDRGAYLAQIKVSGFIKGVLVEQAKPFEFFIEKVSCDSCMKLTSNYREAIIQLRSSSAEDAEPMVEVARQLLVYEKQKDSLAAIIKTQKGPTGYDLWIGSKKAAGRVVRKLEKLYKTHAKISKKLIGEETDRTQKFRVTYLIRK